MYICCTKLSNSKQFREKQLHNILLIYIFIYIYCKLFNTTEMSSWSSEQLKFNGEDFDYDMDYLLFGKYAKLNSHTVSNNCHSGQSSVYNVSNSMTRIMNTPFCLPNPPPAPPPHHHQNHHHNPPSHRHSSMHPMNSALPPPSQPMIITDGWRNTDLCLDNFNYTTGSVNMNQLCEENVHLSRNSDGSNNHSDEYLHDDSDVEPKLNLTDPLMTDIAVGDLDDNSPISTNEYEMLLMPASSSSTSLSLSSSSSSSNGYNGCYSHPNSVCSTPTEVDLFNSSIPTSCSTNYTNTNNNNNNNSSLASTMECGSTSSSSSSSSTSSGSCRSFQSSTQQLYNCGNSLMKTVKQSGGCDKLLYRSTDNTPTTTISSMNKTPSPVVTAAPSPSPSSLIDETMKPGIEQSSDDSNHARRSQQQYEEGCGLFSTKSHGYNRPPVWQMRFNRKQQQQQQPHQQQHSNNSPAVSLLTRFRHQHHQHHPSSVNQAMKRRFTSPLKKVTLSSVNERSNAQMLFLNAGYSTPPLEHCNYSSSTSSPPIPLQMTHNNGQHQGGGVGGAGGGEHIPFPSHHQHDSSSTYTFQLSPSLSECHYNEKAFYYSNTTTTINSNNMSSMLNGDWLKNEKHDLSCVHSTPLSSSKSISNMNNTASTHSITTTTTATNPTTDATITTTNTTAATTNSVVCKSPSRNYSITPPNPVQKRLHLLQFISKILQYSSPESSLFTPGASSTSSSSSSHHHHRSSAFISPPVVICSSSSSTPASVSVSSSSSPISTPFYSANNQQDELIPHLFTMNSQFLNCVQWIDKQARIFQIRNPQKLSQLWGYYRKNENMTFESVSRSLR
ncbi:unnamed protein product [Trichobilharzia szidati]|nr:unnamed protein product [Trichobilharzia szidati]